MLMRKTSLESRRGGKGERRKRGGAKQKQTEPAAEYGFLNVIVEHPR